MSHLTSPSRIVATVVASQGIASIKINIRICDSRKIMKVNFSFHDATSLKQPC